MREKLENILLKLKRVVIVVAVGLFVVCLFLFVKNNSSLSLPSFTSIVPSWTTICVVFAAAVLIIVLSVVIPRWKNSTTTQYQHPTKNVSGDESDANASTPKNSMSAATANTSKKRKIFGGWLWKVTKLATVVVLTILAFCYYTNNKTSNCDSTNTKKIISRRGPLPLPPEEERRSIVLNKNDWTVLPKARNGQAHFEAQYSATRFLVKCVKYLPDGSPQVIKICKFGGTDGVYLDFPSSDRYEMKTTNSEQAVIYWWED